MITTNFKNYAKSLLSTSANGFISRLPATNVSGTTRYIVAKGPDSNAFPYLLEQNFVLSSTNGGISVGTGSTSPTENDYNLESTITSGLSGSITTSQSLDASNNPQVTFLVALTNTSSGSITVSEIGYKQRLGTSSTQGSTSSTQGVFLFDRTVLTTPLTIPAGESGVIKYVLKTTDAA